MCIIAVIPQGKQITKETLKTCWENNTHGGGFAYTNGKQVETFKELNSFKRFYAQFIACREMYKNSTFIVHFRISTHGKINLDNCHPFKVNNQIAFAHNGIIHNSTRNEDYSDTVMFNEEILKGMPKGFLFNTIYHKLIQAYIGSGSKLAFLTHDNKSVIINEEAGVWDDGVWFSNQGYKRLKYLDYGGTNVGWGNNFYGANYKGIKDAQVPSKLPSQTPSVPSAMPKSTYVKDAQAKFWQDDDYANDFIYKPHVPVQGLKRYSGAFRPISKVSQDNQTFELGCSMCGTSLNTKTERENDLCFGCDDMYSGDFSV